MNIDKFKEQIEKDTAYYKEMLEQLDSEGRFDDRMPNSGEKYDNDSELEDLIRYAENIKKPNSLAFWRG